MKKLFDIVTLSDCPDCVKSNRRKSIRRLAGWESAIPIIGQFLPLIFGGSIDPGHWQGSLYIPGDLNSRVATTNQKIATSGLGQYASQDEWMLILQTPGIWQSNIDSYISNVLRGRANGTVPMPTNVPGGYGSSMGGILPILLVGGLLWFFVSDSKKSKAKK
jgi:hypothetical protein